MPVFQGVEPQPPKRQDPERNGHRPQERRVTPAPTPEAPPYTTIAPQEGHAEGSSDSNAMAARANSRADEKHCASEGTSVLIA